MRRQLDIFEDSRDVALGNDLAQALLTGDAVAACRIASALRADFGEAPILAPAEVLVEHLDWRQSLAADGRLEVARILDARQRLEGPVMLAAAAVFGGPDARAWMDAQWCWLAGQATRIVWHPSHADAYAAALYLCGRSWRQAAESVARIESWRKIPVPLSWMTQARWRTQGADAAWPLLAEALWLAPARAPDLLAELADTQLARLVARFEERFEPAATSTADWAWLPAFALIEQPLLADPLSQATGPTGTEPGAGFSVVMALLRLERQGRHNEIVAHRARLKGLSAPLFAAYMVTR